jgi:hypothetical protein
VAKKLVFPLVSPTPTPALKKCRPETPSTASTSSSSSSSDSPSPCTGPWSPAGDVDLKVYDLGLDGGEERERDDVVKRIIRLGLVA